MNTKEIIGNETDNVNATTTVEVEALRAMVRYLTYKCQTLETVLTKSLHILADERKTTIGSTPLGLSRNNAPKLILKVPVSVNAFAKELNLALEEANTLTLNAFDELLHRTKSIPDGKMRTIAKESGAKSDDLISAKWFSDKKHLMTNAENDLMTVVLYAAGAWLGYELLFKKL